jgi:hypothetical protein
MCIYIFLNFHWISTSMIIQRAILPLELTQGACAVDEDRLWSKRDTLKTRCKKSKCLVTGKTWGIRYSTAKFQTEEKYTILASPDVTYADLVEGAETVSTVLNNSKILFRELPEKLITFGRKKYLLLRIYIGLSMSFTLKSPSRSIPDILQVVFDF